MDGNWSEMNRDMQALFSQDFQTAIHAPVITTGNELAGNEIVEFSRRLDLKAQDRLHQRYDFAKTQEDLAERIYVSAKAVSKWETGKGFPDISLLEPLASALDISVIELLSGEDIRNRNRAFNMLRSVWYVCPACGNVI